MGLLCSGGALESRQKLEAVDRMDPVECQGGFSRLVRLQMPDQVPGDLEAARRVDRAHLRYRFLDSILTEISQTSGDRGPRPQCAKLLGHGNESNRRRLTASSRGGE